MGDQQSTSSDRQEDSPQTLIRRAEAKADQWRDEQEEWAEQALLATRFRLCKPHQLIEMMKACVNEDGHELSSDEYEALCEA